MNTFLHLVDGYLNYNRGKAVGVWGIIGVGLALFLTFNVEYLMYIVEFLGIREWLTSLGVFRDGEALYIDGFRLFIFFISFLLIVLVGVLIFLVGMVLFGILAPIAPYIVIPLAIILLPVAGILALPVLAINKLIDLYLMLTQPIYYAEKKRLRKNKKIINMLIHGFEYKKILDYCQRKQAGKLTRREKRLLRSHGDVLYRERVNLLTEEEAYKRINRLPTLDYKQLVIGIGYDRRIYLIFPCPINLFHNGWKEKGEVYAEIITPSVKKKEVDEKTRKWWEFTPLLANTKYSLRLRKKKWNEFEYFIDISRLYSIYSPPSSSFYNYVRSEFYLEYMRNTQLDHFAAKKNLIKHLQKAENDKEYNQILSELENHHLPNEEDIRPVVEERWKKIQHETNNGF